MNSISLTPALGVAACFLAARLVAVALPAGGPVGRRGGAVAPAGY